jgi:hypothetical protein
MSTTETYTSYLTLDLHTAFEVLNDEEKPDESQK